MPAFGRDATDGAMSTSLLSLLAAVLLAGCATTAAPPAEAPWQDDAFGYDAKLVTVTRESLFALDPVLLETLKPEAERGQAARITELLRLVFGPDLKAFAYSGGHSTTAAETWSNKRGDCLSLTVMSYALARALQVPLQMQEVRVPVLFDRRDGVDFLNLHVNSIVQSNQALRTWGETLPAGELVVDFQPQIGSRRRGTPLDENAMLARYYNNIAAEYLAADNDRLAYAHFKAAILTDPGYAASYSNLAQLYLRRGLDDSAEAALRHALTLNVDSELALSALHKLLLSQHRNTEAVALERQLRAERDDDPYYWLGLGLERLQQERYGDAVSALQHAQALTNGFSEVHVYLALAYWRSGKAVLARDQLAILGALDRSNPKLAVLSHKFKAGK